MGLPWRVHGVMLAGTEEYYRRQLHELTAAFHAAFASGMHGVLPACDACCASMCHFMLACGCHTGMYARHSTAFTVTAVLSMQNMFCVMSDEGHLLAEGCGFEEASKGDPPLEWRQRVRPRKFGSVLPGDVAACRQVCGPELMPVSLHLCLDYCNLS